MAGALLSCAPAGAQDVTSPVAERIDSTFALVTGNTADLAVPLARRALARRLKPPERAEPASELPAPAIPDQSKPVAAAAVASETRLSDSALEEEGSADDSEDMLSRLPRPRPGNSMGETRQELIGRPLDLVAGASIPVPSWRAAAVEPRVLPATRPAEIMAAAASDAAQGEAADHTELVAGGSCLTPDDASDKDGDLARNAELLSGPTFCIREKTFKERGRTWRVQTVAAGRPGPLWAIMHDDEDDSFDNAARALKAYGGTLIALETGGTRLLAGIDPNRNFSADGVGCSKLGAEASEEFTHLFKGLFDPTQPIIALHNNGKKPTSTGGYGHASMKTVPKDMRVLPSANPAGALAGDDALVLLADLDTSEGDKNVVSSAAAVLNAAGVNVVVEVVREGRGDCSLSNYALLTGHRSYINVSVGHGEKEKQRKIIDVVMSGRPDTVASQ